VFIIFMMISSSLSNNLASNSALTTQVATKQDDTTRIAALEAKLASLTSTLNSLVGGTSKYNSSGYNLIHYLYGDAVVYQDIFNAYNSNIIQKVGSPAGWDETSYATNPWNGKRILKIGGGVNNDANGIRVNVPSGGYDVLWIRILNDRWESFRITKDGGQDSSEIYASGYRRMTAISPDGTSPDSQWDVHAWMPIPIRSAGSYMIYSAQNSDDWISGIAFGKNLWNHAMNSAVAYYWKLNGGTGNVAWNTENWNNDQLGYLPAGGVYELIVPVVYSGNDKLIYIIQHNDNWNGTMHGAVSVNGQSVERFRMSYYNNPFAVHFGSKLYNRYMATRIPASLIQPGDKFVTLRIDMGQTNNHLYFREIGTHDYI